MMNKIYSCVLQKRYGCQRREKEDERVQARGSSNFPNCCSHTPSLGKPAGTIVSLCA